MTYGKLPEVIKTIRIDCNEYMHYQYMPIKMIGDVQPYFEDRLSIFSQIIWAALDDFKKMYGVLDCINSYMYITAKCKYQSNGCGFNRPGYHTDGFGTNDINYTWSDVQPTVFNTTKFELSDNEHLSLDQMDLQARPENEVTYPNFTLLRLDKFVVHKVGEILDGKRTFVKISFSKDRYNLAGNTHNYLLNYKWNMHQRLLIRNVPQFREGL